MRKWGSSCADRPGGVPQRCDGLEDDSAALRASCADVPPVVFSEGIGQGLMASGLNAGYQTANPSTDLVRSGNIEFYELPLCFGLPLSCTSRG